MSHFVSPRPRTSLMLALEPPDETESIQHQILAESNSKELKHAPPDIRTLTKVKLTEGMIKLLKELMLEMRMFDKVKEYWEGANAA